jgi:LruC domain-containing protein
MKKILTYCLTIWLGCLTTTTSAIALESVQLTDVIKSQGTGNIDLFKDVSADQLEQFRLDNGGMLVLAVDINEDSSGSETSTSQGVAVKRVVLDIRFDDGSQLLLDSFSSPECCFTETQALLAEAPSEIRESYFTLLGESGSSRISANNTTQDIFDSTLKIGVNQALYDPASKSAVSADLQIVLLQTNDQLGDPEAYYDFSAGFEDLALLNMEDSVFIDDYAAGREEAPAIILTNPPPEVDSFAITSWNYFPSASSFYVVGYEDLYPNKGDYDFNDLTVAYRMQHGLNAEGAVVALQGIAYLITRGSAYSHDWNLAIALPSGAGGALSCSLTPNYRTPGQHMLCPGQADALQDGLLDLPLFEDTLVLFPDPAGSLFVNTQRLYSEPWNLKFFPGPRAEFRLDFDLPVSAADIQSAPYDPYLFVRDTGQEVRLMEVDPAYQDIDGYPFGMLLTDSWQPPLEFTDTAIAYPRFDEFVATEGASSSDWYLENLVDFIVDIPDSSGWAW